MDKLTLKHLICSRLGLFETQSSPKETDVMDHILRVTGWEWPKKDQYHDYFARFWDVIRDQRKDYEKQTADRNFYKSAAWKAVRYQALKRSSGHCECCGARSSFDVTLNVDHIRPRSLYPDLELDPDNLQILCGDCNTGKGNGDSIDWRVTA